MLDDTELHISYVEVYGNTLVDLLATKRRNLGPPGVKEVRHSLLLVKWPASHLHHHPPLVSLTMNRMALAMFI